MQCRKQDNTNEPCLAARAATVLRIIYTRAAFQRKLAFKREFQAYCICQDKNKTEDFLQTLVAMVATALLMYSNCTMQHTYLLEYLSPRQRRLITERFPMFRDGTAR